MGTDEIKALEADSPAEDAEDHVEQDEQVPIDAEDAGQTEDAHLPTDVPKQKESMSGGARTGRNKRTGCAGDNRRAGRRKAAC